MEQGHPCEIMNERLDPKRSLCSHDSGKQRLHVWWIHHNLLVFLGRNCLHGLTVLLGGMVTRMKGSPPKGLCGPCVFTSFGSHYAGWHVLFIPCQVQRSFATFAAVWMQSHWTRPCCARGEVGWAKEDTKVEHFSMISYSLSFCKVPCHGACSASAKDGIRGTVCVLTANSTGSKRTCMLDI